MKKKTMRIVVIIVAAAMLLTILVPALAVLAGASSGKVTEDDIDKIKGELSDISAQRAQAQAQLSAIRGDLSRAKEQISLIEGQITLAEHEISISRRILDQYDQNIQAKERQIADLEEQEAAQYAQCCSHVRWLEETGSVSYLSILFHHQIAIGRQIFAYLILQRQQSSFHQLKYSRHGLHLGHGKHQI